MQQGVKLLHIMELKNLYLKCVEIVGIGKLKIPMDTIKLIKDIYIILFIISFTPDLLGRIYINCIIFLKQELLLINFGLVTLSITNSEYMQRGRHRENNVRGVHVYPSKRLRRGSNVVRMKSLSLVLLQRSTKIDIKKYIINLFEINKSLLPTR